MKTGLMKLAVAAGAATLALFAGLGGAQAAQTTAHAASPPILRSVKCVGNSFCIGAGSYTKSKQQLPLIEEWNGKTWRIIPNPSGYQSDITCGGPTVCMASVALPKKPTREVLWNGKTWRQLDSQPPAFDIGCLSPTFCVNSDTAHGSDGNYWNGKIWQDMPMGTGGCGGAWCTYSGVLCASASICWDSGTYCATTDCDGGEISFYDVWNGTAWNVNNGPVIHSANQSCTGRAFCLTLNPPGASISHDWGVTWQDASANLAAACHRLGSCAAAPDTSCGTPHFCMALADPARALVWNGSKWGTAKLPPVSGHQPQLSNLSCGGPRNCVAMGTYQLNPRGAVRPVIEHWNGKAWTVTSIAKV